MGTGPECASLVEDKTNERLLGMLANSNDWRPEVLEAAAAELQKRQVDPEEIYRASMTRGQPVIKTPQTFAEIAFSLKGRIPRSTFWRYHLLLLGAYIPVLLIFFLGSKGTELLPGREVEDGAYSLLCFGLFLWSALTICASTALQIKRWHDLGVTGCATLINIVPIVNVLVILIGLGGFPGNPGTNEYGADPLSVSK